MGKDVSDYDFPKKPVKAARRLTAFFLAVLLIITLLPANISAKAVENTPVLTIGGTVVLPENAGDYGFSSMETTDDAIILTVDGQIPPINDTLETEGNLIITGSGSLSINAGGKAHGISVEGDLTITGTGITVSAGRNAAIYSTGDIYIENSYVKAMGRKGTKGIIAGKAVTTSGSWVESTGMNYDLGMAENSIVFQEQEGVMTGSITGGEAESGGMLLPCSAALPCDLEIPEGILLVIPEGRTLTVPADHTLTVTGMIENSGTINVDGNLEDPGEQIENIDNGKVTGVEVSEIILDTEEADLNVGESIVISATIVPYYAENQTITWSSSDGSIASAENGTVKALHSGEAVITASTANGKTAECTITVPGTKVTGVSLDPSEAQMHIGETLQLEETVIPENADNQNVTWTSNNESVASVDEDGLVTAEDAGTATITVTTEDGGKTAQCTITVLKIPVTGVSLNYTTAELRVKKTLQLTETVTPENADNQNVTWSSSDETIASVDEDGLVTAKDAGTAIITVTTEDGDKTAQCTITVLKTAVTGVSLNQSTTHMYVRETLQLKETVAPENADNKDVTWSSSNEAVASVNENGLVTAKNAGTATITVTTEDGGKTAECAITVEAVPVQQIKLEPVSTTLPLGKTLALKSQVLPENATNPGITWTSSEPSIASVDADGTVKALKTGTVTITAAAVDGSGITGTSEITVIVIPVTGIKLNRTTASIQDDGTMTLHAEVLPADATYKTITWRSDNPQVAAVDAKGKVTAVKTGTARIIATSADGKKQAVCTVTVTPPDKAANAVALNKKIGIFWNAKKKSMIVSWGKAPDADGYEVYAAECGTSMKLIKTITSPKPRSFTLKKVNGRKLKTQKSYKALVRAYRIFNGKKQYLAKSYSVHAVTDSNKKYTNVKKLTVSPKTLSLKREKSKKLVVRAVSQNRSRRRLGHIQKLRYFTTDSKVATVSGNGVIRAVGKGSCTVYVLSINGMKASVKVTVK